jgi:hypothetical protein
MIRYSIFLAIIVASTATAIAAISPAPVSTPTRNITVMEKNQAFPVYGPIVVEQCAVEDCSDTV